MLRFIGLVMLSALSQAEPPALERAPKPERKKDFAEPVPIGVFGGGRWTVPTTPAATRTVPGPAPSFQELAAPRLQLLAPSGSNEELNEDEGKTAAVYSKTIPYFEKLSGLFQHPHPEFHELLQSYLSQAHVYESPLDDSLKRSIAEFHEKKTALSIDKLISSRGKSIFICEEGVQLLRVSEESRAWLLLHGAVLGVVPEEDPRREYKALKFILDLDYALRHQIVGLPQRGLDERTAKRLIENLARRKHTEDLSITVGQLNRLRARLGSSPPEELDALIAKLGVEKEKSEESDLEAILHQGKSE